MKLFGLTIFGFFLKKIVFGFVWLWVGVVVGGGGGGGGGGARLFQVFEFSSSSI